MSGYPHFVCIGAQEAGTDWLRACLKTHPKIALPTVTEVHYFDSLYVKSLRSINTKRFAAAHERLGRKRADTNERLSRQVKWLCDQHGKVLDDAWYSSIFTGKKKLKIRGDITATYGLVGPDGVDHLLRLNPQVKVLLMVRDPVERSFLQALQRKKPGSNPAPEVLLKRVAGKKNVRQSRYPAIIARWSKALPKGHFKVVFYEDVVARPLEVLAEICGFLGLQYDPSYFPAVQALSPKSSELAIPPEVEAFLVKKHLRTVRKLAKKYPQARPWLAKYQGRSVEAAGAK